MSKSDWRSLWAWCVCLGLAITTLNADAALEQGDHKVDWRRGYPSAYDMGPPSDTIWAKLFNDTPNYRIVAKKILKGDDEKFRWQFGPMWYRGRLGRDQVKAFVVGQEGAQDENVSNRAFTGSTGTKTQKFLNFLGIKSGYLFLNTFVYTINGQLDHGNKAFKWMEQDPDSPIVQYRHRLFDYMMEINQDSIQFFMGVGSGGKASLVTWVNARGGDCSASKNMKKCDTRGMIRWFERNYICQEPKNCKKDGKGLAVRAKKVVAVGVPHPGGASPANGGLNALKNIIRGFEQAAKTVAREMDSDSSWMPGDLIETNNSRGELIANLKGAYKYGNAPVPFYDFAFGTNWRMGAQGTTSNRNGASRIQVFGKGGEYNGKGSYPTKFLEDVNDAIVKTAKSGDQNYGPVEMVEEEEATGRPQRPYEASASYDPGPCSEGDYKRGFSCELAQALQKWPNFWDLGTTDPNNDPSFGHGPIYRGSIRYPGTLFIVDQQSHDDFFSGRALTGKAGQQLQKWLNDNGYSNKKGSKQRYAILRTLPVDTLTLDNGDKVAMAKNSNVMASRERILNLICGAVDKVFLIGPAAQSLSGVQPGLGNCAKVQNMSLPSGGLANIPREDLPIHTRWWMGTSGNRAERASGGSYYRVAAPWWVGGSRKNPSYWANLTKQDPDTILAGEKIVYRDKDGFERTMDIVKYTERAMNGDGISGRSGQGDIESQAIELDAYLAYSVIDIIKKPKMDAVEASGFKASLGLDIEFVEIDVEDNEEVLKDAEIDAEYIKISAQMDFEFLDLRALGNRVTYIEADERSYSFEITIADIDVKLKELGESISGRGEEDQSNTVYGAMYTVEPSNVWTEALVEDVTLDPEDEQ